MSPAALDQLLTAVKVASLDPAATNTTIVLGDPGDPVGIESDVVDAPEMLVAVFPIGVEALNVVFCHAITKQYAWLAGEMDGVSSAVPVAIRRYTDKRTAVPSTDVKTSVPQLLLGTTVASLLSQWTVSRSPASTPAGNGTVNGVVLPAPDPTPRSVGCANVGVETNKTRSSKRIIDMPNQTQR